MLRISRKIIAAFLFVPSRRLIWVDLGDESRIVESLLTFQRLYHRSFTFIEIQITLLWAEIHHLPVDLVDSSTHIHSPGHPRPHRPARLLASYLHNTTRSTCQSQRKKRQVFVHHCSSNQNSLRRVRSVHAKPQKMVVL